MPVAETGVEGPPPAECDGLRQRPAAKERQAPGNLAVRRDDRRHAGVRRADDRRSVLHRAKGVHGEVLPRPVRPPEPRVVRHVHDQLRSAPHEFAHELREDPFVTDYDTEWRRRTREYHRAVTGLEFGDELAPAPHEADDGGQRHELSERNEMDLIIT